MTTRFRSKLTFSLALAVVLALLLAPLALADEIVPDGDIVTSGNQNSVNLGTVSPGATLTPQVSFTLVCDSKQHVDYGQTVNLTASAQTVPSGGSLSATNANIGLIPLAWPDDTNNCSSSTPSLNDNGNSNVTITAPTVPGFYTYVVRYAFELSPAANNDNSALKSNHEDVTFTLTVPTPPSDNTPPVISYTVNGVYPETPDGDNGWYVSDAVVDWTVTDPESSFTTVGCVDTTINADTTGTTLICSATSAGGPAGPVSVTVKRDATEPNVTITPGRGTDHNGWYNHSVDFITNGTDDTSYVARCDAVQTYSGPDGSNLTISGSCADNAGNTGNGSFSFKYDATGPSATLAVTAGTGGANGWYTSNVTVSTSGSDLVSGPVTCNADQFQTTETSGTVFNGSCTNDAGLTTIAAPLTVKLDKTGPSASLSAVGTLGNNGWYTSDVTISTSGSDAISEPVSCTSDQYQTTDTAGLVFNGSCTNDAGLRTDTAPLTIKRDASKPTISGSASPAANGAGWNNTNVIVSFTCDDSLSGIASCGPNQTLSSDGAGQSATGTAVDEAGNSASATVSGINIDKTAPSVSVTGVSNGATYTLGSVPAASCSTSDTLSGVSQNASLSLSGGPVGTVTAACSGAKDNAGNSGSASVTYSVIYNWNGFFQPVDNDLLNVAKAGSAIPVKFSLSGNQGLGIFIAGYPKSKQIVCDTGVAQDAIEATVTAGSSGLNYDATVDQYVYVWKTDKAWGGTCRQFYFQLIDNTIHSFNVKFVK